MSIDNAILDFVKANPDTGLYEISNHIYASNPDEWARAIDPVLACRGRCSKRLKSLIARNYLTYTNPTGKRALYRIKE